MVHRICASQWNSYIELAYSVFVRQYENVQYKIDSAKKSFLDVWNSHAITSKYLVEFEEPFDTYWPVKPEDIEKCEKKGYLLTNYEDTKCVVVREVSARINISEINFHVNIQSLVEKACNEEFAVIRVVREKTLEIQAI